MKKRLLNSLTLALVSLCFGQASAAEQKATPTPTVTVTAPADPSVLAEDALTGPYDKPEWTNHRRFSTTRVYIQQDPWNVGVEQWWRSRSYDDKSPQNRFQEEIEIGLPYRFQLDLYYNWVHEAGSTHTDETAVELRYALADWGKIWGNPTLYFEYAFVPNEYGGDKIESKLLLGDDFGKGWHWGLNFVFESEMSHELAKEVVIAGGISRTIIDEVLSAGLEMQWKRETVAGERNDPEVQFEIGPSVQWRLSKKTHLDLVALFGTTDQGPSLESFVIFGWDFGNINPNAKGHSYKPTSVGQ